MLGPHADRPGAARDAYLRYSVRSWKGADACHAAPDDPSESFSIHWQDSFVCGDRADSEGMLRNRIEEEWECRAQICDTSRVIRVVEAAATDPGADDEARLAGGPPSSKVSAAAL